MMPKGPTVYDVAERAGVSIATVSFAFRRPEKVKASTREMVLAVARELGYVPSASARGLAHGRTRALGLFAFEYLLESADQPLLVPGADPPAAAVPPTDDLDEDFRLFPLYVDEVQRGVELECWRRGYALMVGGRGHANIETVLADIAGRVDGLAVFPHTVPDDVLARIAWRIPVVEMSESAHDDQLNHVTVDNVAGMRSLTEHLITTHGLRTFAFVGDTGGSDQLGRFQGFQAALAAAGLPVPAMSISHRGGVIRQAAIVVDAFRTNGAFPDALVCATDQEALALMDALRHAGVAVPTDIAVTGFDGIAAGRIIRPTLTTVRQPMEHMGRAVVDILIAQLDNPGQPPMSRQLPVRVVLRESCGCPSR
jgi:DNA-binding LacI/PurR family transcriptional regulator